MSVGPPLFSGQLYRLPPAGSVNGINAANAAQFSGGFESLLSRLEGNAGSGGLSDAFLLNLSPEALETLNGFSAPGTGSDLFGNPTGIPLSRAQQETITALLTRYKDAPFTQETYERIQADLKVAGLAPDQLIVTQTLSEYDPSGVLLTALAGEESSLPSTASFITDAQSQAAANNYMQQIVNEWQGISSTATAA